MVKGFSDNKVKDNTQNTQIKEKKGLAGFLKGKKFTYTLPGKKTNKYFWINSNRLKYHFSIASHPVFKESRIP
jgi:hypothetical protein